MMVAWAAYDFFSRTRLSRIWCNNKLDYINWPWEIKKLGFVHILNLFFFWQFNAESPVHVYSDIFSYSAPCIVGCDNHFTFLTIVLYCVYKIADCACTRSTRKEHLRLICFFVLNKWSWGNAFRSWIYWKMHASHCLIASWQTMQTFPHDLGYEHLQAM